MLRAFSVLHIVIIFILVFPYNFDWNFSADSFFFLLLRSLFLCLYDVFLALINDLVCRSFCCCCCLFLFLMPNLLPYLTASFVQFWVTLVICHAIQPHEAFLYIYIFMAVYLIKRTFMPVSHLNQELIHVLVMLYIVQNGGRI